MDTKIKNLINKEIRRQEETLDLIASENIASDSILGILGSPLVNKYSEGYSGKRYYPGNAVIDELENLAKSEALKAFGLKEKDWGVNVQPYSGSPANQAVYFALLNPGDVVMGLSLSSGGHLTHGHKVNFSGKAYKSIQYGLKPNGEMDYLDLEKKAKEFKPKLIISGATAYSKEIDFKKIGEIAKKIGAYHLADISHIAGFVAIGEHQAPFPYADVVTSTMHKSLRGPRGAVIFSKKENVKSESGDSKVATIAELIDRAVFPGLQGGPHNNVTAAIAECFIEVQKQEFKKYALQALKNAGVLALELKKLGFKLVSDGTDNHLILLDLKEKKISGLEAEKRLEENGILANRNSVPGDDKPFNPSGIRLGTLSLTSRGMMDGEMKLLADLINKVVINNENVAEEVKKLCLKFSINYKPLE